MDTFSFTRLQLYQTCPQRFYYNYVLGKEEPSTKPLALGEAVHKAIECIINGMDIENAIKEGLIACDFHEEVTPNEIRELVERTPFEKFKGETELYFRIPLFDYPDSPALQGYIDLVDGNRIMDFKTNRKAYNVTDTYQVGIYAWALSKIRGFNQVEGSLYFLRHRKESTFIFNEAMMEEAADWARALVNEIRFKLNMLEFKPEKWNELFPYKPSGSCSHCPFTLECYKANRYIL
jgi:CRISPR/Cas system-associated exonuclease Cas4 (RecB family)